MPRITPLRIVISLVASYFCLLGVWLALPFPPNAIPGRGNAYHERILKSGKILSTVHETGPATYSSRNVYGTARRHAYAADWNLLADSSSNSILLRIGQNTRVNLTQAALQDAEFQQTQYIEVQVRSGDLDGANPPWFAYADAMLLYWDIQGDMMETDMSIVSAQPGQVQIWPAEQYDENYQPKARIPLATFSNIPLQGDRDDISAITVSDMSSDVPSRTFIIRHYIIIFLAPLTLAIMAIAGPLSSICFAIAYLMVVFVAVYSIVLYICWAFNGFPPWHEFKEQFLLTRGWSRRARHRRRTIWGASGPLPDGSDLVAEHGEGDIDVAPQPLTSIGQFFRSSSPLDDFCATFECTKWMLQPVRRTQQRHVSPRTPTEDLKMPNEAKIRIASQV